MSHSSATFVFQDGTKFFGEYNGTADVMINRMHATPEERHDHWRHFCKDHSCQHAGEPCIAHSDYGGGFYWMGRACRECMVFLGPYHVLSFDYKRDSEHPPSADEVDWTQPPAEEAFDDGMW